MFVSFFLNLLSPPHCAYCKVFLQSRVPLCITCNVAIIPIASHVIKLTESNKIVVHAIADYQEPLRALILAKQRSDHVAILQLAEIMIERLSLELLDFDCIVPIPLHWYRKAWRGFNQTELIAQVISRKCKKPVVPLLQRSRRTTFQSTLSAEQRIHNVQGAFTCTKKMIEQYTGKKILLVDDLMTTGATLHEAGSVLLASKPISISAVVACRVIS